MSTSTIPPVSSLIYVSCMPVIKLILSALGGFVLQRTGFWTQASSRAVSQIILKVALPCLLFSSIVTSFSPENVSSLGPLILVGILYIIVPLCLSFVARWLFRVPNNFRWGFIFLTTWANWGDIPIAVLGSICAVAPFNASTDPDLAIAYSAIVILVFFITVFVMRGCDLIALDYRKPPADIEKSEKRVDAASLSSIDRRRAETGHETGGPPGVIEELETQQSRASSRARSKSDATKSATLHETPTAARRVWHSVKGFLWTLLQPPTLALILGLICALVTPLQALFVETDQGSFHPEAPDGRPPLNIVYETTSFVGAASVPTSLIMLGASIAGMRIPKPVSRLPIASMLSVIVIKLVIMPIFGFFVVEALAKHTSLIAMDNYVLRFVLIWIACPPSPTTAIAFTNVFAPEGTESNADVVAAYLLVQYPVFIISSVILTVVSLRAIF